MRYEILGLFCLSMTVGCDSSETSSDFVPTGDGVLVEVDNTDVESTGVEATVEVTTVEESTVEEPTVEVTTVEETTVEETTVEVTTVEETTVEEPTVEETTVEETTVEETTVEETTVEETTVEETTVEETTVEETTVEETTVEETTVEETTVEEIDTANYSLIGCEDDLSEMLDLINTKRTQIQSCGGESLGPVAEISLNLALTLAAEVHSSNMANYDFFSHTGLDGGTVGTRVTDQGYTWSYVAENIAAGQTSVQEVVDGWMLSEGHCRNIMSENVIEVGFACEVNENADYTRYWTQVFAKPM